MPSSSESSPDVPPDHQERARRARERDLQRQRDREAYAERRRRARRSRPDLDVLHSEPSLASLRWSGWHLDGLPTTSVAYAFAAALGTALFTYGAVGAALVVASVLVAVLLAASAMLMRDVPAARATLRLARLGLLGVVLVSAAHL